MNKYEKLKDYLLNNQQNTIKLSFDQISKIIGFPLPRASLGASFWTNVRSHKIASAWMEAGYMVSTYSMSDKYIVFEKTDKFSKNYQLSPGEKLEPETAEVYVNSYYNEMLSDLNSQYRAWQHCYKVFDRYKNRMDEEIIDLLSLHLSIYLANSGMYRGASFLLQKDYKLQYPIVKYVYVSGRQGRNE